MAVVPSPIGNESLGNIVSEVYRLLNQNEDSATFSKSQRVIPKINAIQNQICKGSYVNPLDRNKFSGGDLSFLESQKYIDYISPVSLNNDITTTSTEIDTQTDNLLSASSSDPQYVLINQDIIQYEGVIRTTQSDETPTGSVNGVNKVFTTAYSMKTVSCVSVDGSTSGVTYTFSGTTLTITSDAPTTSITVSYTTQGKLTGVSHIETSHKAGNVIKQIYEVPSTVTKPYQLRGVTNGYGSGYNSSYYDGDYEVVYVDCRSMTRAIEYFSILHDKDTQKTFVVVYAGNNLNKKYVVRMYLRSEDMVNNDDICTLPDDYGITVLAPLVTGELLLENEEPDSAQEKFFVGTSKLASMYDFYASRVDKFVPQANMQNLDLSTVSGFRERRRRYKDFSSN